MNIAWLLHEDIQPGVADVELMQRTGVTWGSWKTFATYRTQNTVSYYAADTRELVNKHFYQTSNLYISADDFLLVRAPPQTQQFAGRFPDVNVLFPNTIVATNLVASQYEVVLMVGFDLAELSPMIPEAARHRNLSYYHNIKSVITSNPATQFVILDHRQDLHKLFVGINNLTVDTIQSVQEQLS